MDVPHRIERTRNRHSRAVYRDDTIIIRLARGLSVREEHEHIEYLLRRMVKQVARERSRVSVDPFRPLLEGHSEHRVALASGTSYLFQLRPGTRTKATRTAEGWDIQISQGTRRRALHRFLWRLVSAAELPTLTREVHRINALTFQESLGPVRVSYASSQWGSCGRHKQIHLNPVLLFLPKPLLDYVIVHELAHCQFRNHSKNYWNHVASVLPSYREARKALRTIRICPL